jgi:putative phosphoribosyl transferase
MSGGGMTEFASSERAVCIGLPRATLKGDLGLPRNPSGVVLIPHDDESNRLSPQHRFVAKTLRAHGIGTLHLNLLTDLEAEIDKSSSKSSFNIPFLAARLASATRWTLRQPELRSLNIGYLATRKGAAVALLATARQLGTITAVVSDGGRPDLAEDFLPTVAAPTLLIVAGLDHSLMEMNHQALEKLGCMEKKLLIIPDATSTFEEPGALKDVARLAAGWFSYYFALRNGSEGYRAAQVL